MRPADGLASSKQDCIATYPPSVITSVARAAISNAVWSTQVVKSRVSFHRALIGRHETKTFSTLLLQVIKLVHIRAKVKAIVEAVTIPIEHHTRILKPRYVKILLYRSRTLILFNPTEGHNSSSRT